MPIYEYRCEACGGEQEILQSVKAEPLTECPECGQPALKKLVSAAAFHLKGTGWYVTDFRDKDKKKPGGKEEQPKEEQKGNGETKAEAKSDKDSTSDSKSKADASAKSKGSDSAASA